MVNEVFDLFAALDATDEQLDFPILYGSGQAGLDGATSPKARRTRAWRRCSTWCCSHVPAPTRRGRPVPHARHHPRSQSLSSAASSPAASTPASVKPNQAVKVLRPRRQAGRERPHLEDPRLPRHRARSRSKRPQAGDIVAIAGLPKGTVADTFCDPSVDRAAAGAADRSADRDHDLPRQRLAARRHRRRQGHEPRHPRPPAARGRRQCRAARSRKPPTRIRSTSPAAANCSSPS